MGSTTIIYHDNLFFFKCYQIPAFTGLHTYDFRARLNYAGIAGATALQLWKNNYSYWGCAVVFLYSSSFSYSPIGNHRSYCKWQAMDANDFYYHAKCKIQSMAKRLRIFIGRNLPGLDCCNIAAVSIVQMVRPV